MAHLAFAGWTTTFTLMNTGTAPLQATLNCFDNNGIPLSVTLVFPQSSAASGPPTFTTTFPVNPGSGQLVQTAGLTGQPTQVGWTQLLTTGNLDGFAVLQQATGTSIQEALVPLENRNPTAFETWFDNTGDYSTGIALANTGSRAVNIPVVIHDDTGATLMSTTIQLAAQGHTSFDLASTLRRRPVSEALSSSVRRAAARSACWGFGSARRGHSARSRRWRSSQGNQGANERAARLGAAL